MIVIGADGEPKVTVLRDATPAPTRPKRRLSPKSKAVATVVEAAQPQEATSDGAATLPPPL